MDVTDQINKYQILYGSSDNTNPATIAAAKKLNYAEGASIQKPSIEKLSLVPQTINYNDTVGLFGVENHFVKVLLKLMDPVSGCYPENTYLCAEVSDEEMVPADPYTFTNTGTTPGQAYVDFNADLNDDGTCKPIVPCINTYQPANILDNTIPKISNPRVSVLLENLHINNQYIDDWLDVRLYTRDRMEHPYNLMYVRPNDYFYVGFHARNTKRLPYNVNLTVGEQYISESEITDRRYIAKRIN